MAPPETKTPGADESDLEKGAALASDSVTPSEGEVVYRRIDTTQGKGSSRSPSPEETGARGHAREIAPAITPSSSASPCCWP